MLSLSVRTVLPEDYPAIVRFFPDSQEVMCLRLALNFILRLLQDRQFPKKGLNCVSVIRIPDNYAELIAARQYRIGELMFHAVRYEKTAAVPIAPLFAHTLLTIKPSGIHPMPIDLRHTCPEILPEAVRAIVPDSRTVQSAMND